ncbi:MAG: PAS domain S-box protein [Lentisphaerota bacterium]
MSNTPKIRLQTLDEALIFAENIIETVRESLIVLDFDLRVISANKSFYEAFKVNPKQTIGLLIYDLGNGQWNITKLQHLLEDILPNKSSFYDYEIEHSFESIGKKAMLLNARLIPETQLILLAIEDISERKEREKEREISFYRRSLLETSLNSLATISAEGKITDVNAATEKVTGLSREKLIGTDFMDYFSEPERASAVYLKAFEHGKVIDYPLAICHASGTITDVLYNASVYRNEQGEVLGVFAAAHDITERKKIEQRLLDAENNLINIMYSSHDALLFVDGLTFVDCNEATVSMLGYAKKADFLQAHPSKLSPPVQPDGRASFEKANQMTEFAFARGFHRFEWVHRKANGEDFPVEVSLTPIIMKGKNILHCLWRDITERKKAEDKIASLARDWQKTFDSVTSAIFILNHESIILQCNKSTELFLGKTRSAIIGHHCWEIVHGATGPISGCPLIEMKKDSHTKVRVLQVGDKSFQVTVDPTFDDDGNLTGAVHIIDDITERKKAQELERVLIKTKSDFISMVSHELRSPIGAMLMGLDYIFDEPTDNLNAKQLEILTLSRTSIERLTRLINNTLDLQKLTSGTVSLDIHSYNINNLVEEIKSSMIRLANEKNIYFNLHLDESMPLIPFDRDKLIQVLVNLVSNAVKFTDKGGITISTESLKNEVVVSVRDEGIGIAQKDISTLFVPFHQLGNARNHKKGSSGLGLSISKTIVEAHGGKIWAESKIGEGSVFCFSMPKNKSE